MFAFVMGTKKGEVTQKVSPKAKVAGVKRKASANDTSLHENEAERKRFVSFSKKRDVISNIARMLKPCTFLLIITV